jgi:hypothetical protein
MFVTCRRNNSYKISLVTIIFHFMGLSFHNGGYIDSTWPLCSGSSRFIDAQAAEDIHAYRPL